MQTKKLEAVTLILDSARGVYIPRDFVCGADGVIDLAHCAAWGLTAENRQRWEEAATPESESYWDAWSWILDNAAYTDDAGNAYTLHHDGDLFGLCFERMTDEEKANFGFDE